jgi:hypothetical protein
MAAIEPILTDAAGCMNVCSVELRCHHSMVFQMDLEAFGKAGRTLLQRLNRFARP